MPTSLRTFDALTAALRGMPCAEDEWEAVLTLANVSLTTTTLAARLADKQASLPSDVHIFLSAITDRNRMRNERLLGQLAEMADALAESGVEPVLVKGAAILASATPDTVGDRILSDLDVLVAPRDFAETRDRLLALGYRCLASSNLSNLVAVLGRPEDAGTIDLRGRMPGLGNLNAVLGASWKPFGLRGRLAIPSPSAQVAILVAHDILQGQDYLSGVIDVRHACDIDSLTRTPDGVDWSAVTAMLPSRLATALRSQQLTFKRMFGTDVPVECEQRGRPSLQFQRRRLQIAYPRLKPLLTMVSIGLDPLYVSACRSVLSNGRRLPIRAARLRSICAAAGPGKV